MTDIRQHLPLILTSLRHYLTGAGTPDALLTDLRELLPASYGIGAGQLVNGQGQQSAPFDVILFDRTVNPVQPSSVAGCCDLRQALATIVLVRELDTRTLKDLLRAIASAKALRAQPRQEPAQSVDTETLPGRSSGQTARKPVLKKLLPLGIVACQRVLDAPGDQPEILALFLVIRSYGSSTLLKNISIYQHVS